KAYEGVKRGAYVISDTDKETPDALLLATGSEVSLAIEAQKVLREKGIAVRVVSMPSWDRFEAQPDTYKQEVLPPHVKARVAVEMGSPFGWERYTGESGKILGINTFGASAPGNRVMKEYGFTVDNVVRLVESVVEE
ncbi:MAG: transketolase C-terminal domain-containing protein, partial [Thermoactinomyces sp.]